MPQTDRGLKGSLLDCLDNLLSSKSSMNASMHTIAVVLMHVAGDARGGAAMWLLGRPPTCVNPSFLASVTSISTLRLESIRGSVDHLGQARDGKKQDGEDKRGFELSG